MLKTFAILLAILALPQSLHAQDVSFEALWQNVKFNAPGIKSSISLAEASEATRSRARLHWLPRIYTQGRFFSTNDPGLSFFSLLSQRNVVSSDFNPSTLNHPEHQLVTQGSLGADIALFEGFSKVAEARMMDFQAEGRNAQYLVAVQKHFSDSLRAYAMRLVFMEEHRQLQDLKEKLVSILSRYRVGQTSNPIGYTGLLGLKNLKNRIDGLLNRLENLDYSQKEMLRGMGASLSSEWLPVRERAQTFMRARRGGATIKASRESTYTKSAKQMARAASEMKVIQRARWMPKLGLFAEGNLTNGERATSTSYAGGLYLQWNLFSPTNIKQQAEAEALAASAQTQAIGVEMQAIAEADAAKDAITKIEMNLSLLDESSQMLDEQTRVSKELFQTGSMNALQLAEVLNRRVDLLQDRADAETALIEAHINYYLATASEEPL